MVTTALVDTQPLGTWIESACGRLLAVGSLGHLVAVDYGVST